MAIQVLRLLPQRPFDSIWAEDGQIFLADAERSSLPATLLEPYAGYMHALPRGLAELVTLLPISAAPAALTVSAVAVSSMLALIVFTALVDHIPSTWPRACIAVFLVALPVGRETVGNIANLHWLLVVASVCVLFWTPRSTWGTASGALLLVVTALSNPFGAGLLVVALVRVWVQRHRSAAVFVVCLGVAVTVQFLVMLQAPERSAEAQPSVPRLVATYVSYVVSQATFGESIAGRGARALALGAVGLVLLSSLALATASVMQRRRATGTPLFAAALLLGSLASWLVFYGLSGVATSRYVVVPASLLVIAVVALVVSGARVGSWTAWRRRVLVIAVVVVGAGWLTSVPLPARHGPSWAPQVEDARARCDAGPTTDESLEISPAGWEVLLPCRAFGT
jgi:hypothetical protein